MCYSVIEPHIQHRLFYNIICVHRAASIDECSTVDQSYEHVHVCV